MPVNVAVPATALSVVVPAVIVAPGAPVLGVMAIVTLPVNDPSTCPDALRASTVMSGLIAAPAAALDGCTLKNSAVAVAGSTSKNVLVADVRPGAAAPSR